MKKPVQIELVKLDKSAVDDWGNPITDETRWIVFANRMSVRQSEFYQAANQGLKPSVVFEMYAEELNNADYIICDEVEYSIIRTFQKTLDKIEVICEKKVANGN